MAWVKGRVSALFGAADTGNSAIEYAVAAALIAGVGVSLATPPPDPELTRRVFEPIERAMDSSARGR